MNAVVLTVKASYVASTKYRKLETKVVEGAPLVVWKMKARMEQIFKKKYFLNIYTN